MQVQVERSGKLLRIELTGATGLEELLAFIRALGPDTRTQGDRLVLMNLLALEADFNMTGHMLLGQQAAEYLQHIDRLASVVPADQITRTSEKAARAKGLQLSVFGAEAEALAWLLCDEPAGLPVAVRADEPLLDPIRLAFWEAFGHLFPPHAQAIQLANGSLAISWGMANDPDALYGMSAPITVRFEPALIDSMRLASAEQRKRIATHQEAAFRAGLLGYDPYAVVPKARVIVLG